jgi:hypothetical protein
LPGIDQNPAELITTGGRTVLSEIHEFINSLWNEEELPEQWKDSIIVCILRGVIKQTVVIREAYHTCKLRTIFYLTSCC